MRVWPALSMSVKTIAELFALAVRPCQAIWGYVFRRTASPASVALAPSGS